MSLWLISKWFGHNGAGLLEAVKDGGKSTIVPTLAITNEAPTDPSDKALLAQFRQQMTRPLDPVRLTESIRVLANG
ncbi:MAG: hypothetical protein ACRD2L_16000, partial [Terriglobia bacterium]